jgi:hypothetical protein
MSSMPRFVSATLVVWNAKCFLRHPLHPLISRNTSLALLPGGTSCALFVCCLGLRGIVTVAELMQHKSAVRTSLRRVLPVMSRRSETRGQTMRLQQCTLWGARGSVISVGDYTSLKEISNGRACTGTSLMTGVGFTGLRAGAFVQSTRRELPSRAATSRTAPVPTVLLFSFL